MESAIEEHVFARGGQLRVSLTSKLVSSDALLKTCYWHSRDYACDVTSDLENFSVALTALRDIPLNPEDIARNFTRQAMDFELRERVNARTADVRDILLAKAFAESGVLEDQPTGVFGDVIEEVKPDGLFKILQNG